MSTVQSTNGDTSITIANIESEQPVEGEDEWEDVDDENHQIDA